MRQVMYRLPWTKGFSFFHVCLWKCVHINMHAWPGRGSGLSHCQHWPGVGPLPPPPAIPYTHNLLMEGLATRKLKKMPCWAESAGGGGITLTFYFNTQFLVNFKHVEVLKYQVSQFCWSCSIKPGEMNRPLNEKWPCNLPFFIFLTKYFTNSARQKSFSAFSTSIPLPSHRATSLYQHNYSCSYSILSDTDKVPLNSCWVNMNEMHCSIIFLL